MNNTSYININKINIFIVTLLFVSAALFSPFGFADNTAQTSANNTERLKPIRIVMSAAFVSDSGLSIYTDIFDYLGKKLNRDIDFVSGFSYESINSMLDSGMVDVGFICGLPYVMKKDRPQPSVELLLAPVMKSSKYQDRPIYFSYVIVNKDSDFNKFTDLKGKRFVYNDEISNSGYNMPRAHLIDIGETSAFFDKILRSGSHEESIRMVAIGEADVTAVDSLVYDYDLETNPKYVAQTKIIKILGPAGIPPIVISTKTPPSLRNEIRDVLKNMNNDPVGKKILEKALVDRFTVVDDSNYDGIRIMKNKAKTSGYKVIR